MCHHNISDEFEPTALKTDVETCNCSITLAISNESTRTVFSSWLELQWTHSTGEFLPQRTGPFTAFTARIIQRHRPIGIPSIPQRWISARNRQHLDIAPAGGHGTLAGRVFGWKEVTGFQNCGLTRRAALSPFLEIGRWLGRPAKNRFELFSNGTRSWPISSSQRRRIILTPGESDATRWFPAPFLSLTNFTLSPGPGYGTTT